MKRILIVNGPNINLLGKREPEIYGNETLDEINKKLSLLAVELKLEVTFFQSNSEDELINFVHKEGFDAYGMIINPGAFTHYSYALRDAISSVGIKTVEVHISNIYAREEFRRKSVIAPVCMGTVTGLGNYSYVMALNFFADLTGSK